MDIENHKEYRNRYHCIFSSIQCDRWSRRWILYRFQQAETVVLSKGQKTFLFLTSKHELQSQVFRKDD